MTLIGIIFFISPAAVFGQPIMIDDPWVRAAPPNSQMLAAYMNLMNHGEQDLDLLSISSVDFEKVEVHQSIVEQGMARMRHTEKVTINANQTLKFAPGGFHLMLINPKRALPPGEKVDFILTFSNGLVETVTAPVRKKN